MKKLLFGLLFMCFTVPAFAEEPKDRGLYLKGSLGYFMMEDARIEGALEGEEYTHSGDISFESGYAFSGALGFEVTKNFSVEAEYGFKDAESSHITTPDGSTVYRQHELEIKTFMANAIYNVDIFSSFKPYIGVGVGAAIVTMKPDREDPLHIDDTKFAYQFLAGVETEIAKDVSFLVGYRYLGMGDVYEEFDEHPIAGVPFSGTMSVDTHNVEVGLKYHF